MNQEKIKAAIAIFKARLPEAKGKFRAALSETGGNVVEIWCDGFVYCQVNVRSGQISGI